MDKRNKPSAIWADEDGGVTGYMCLTDFECELGGATGGNIVHPSVEDLRKRRGCVDRCGIVEVEVRARRVVQEASYDDD